jgi:hypothetical protein
MLLGEQIRPQFGNSSGISGRSLSDSHHSTS